MLTKPLNDFHCLGLILLVVMERIHDATAQNIAHHHGSADAYAKDLRLRPQLDDSYGVLPGAPRVACFPPQRIRFDPKDPNCVERAASWLTVAEILDPDTPRTLMTVRVKNQLHVVPVIHTEDGPVPINLDPLDASGSESRLPENLSYAAVAQVLGYGPRQASPVADAVVWAEKLAERDGVQTRNGAQLLAVARRYADVYPGGRQGVKELAEQFGKAVTDAARKTAKVGEQAGKAGKKVAKVGAEEYKKRPVIGQILRSTLVGYGGPLAVVAIDVVENRLNKRGLTLGSLAESHDTDVFAFN